MIFKKEMDVRRWLRRNAKVWWIENKRGGSVGFPDAVVAGSAGAVFLELKIAAPRAGCGWVVEAAPAQSLALQNISSAGLSAWLVAGLENSTRLGAIEGGKGMERIGGGAGVGRRATWAVRRWDLEWDEKDGWPSELG